MSYLYMAFDATTLREGGPYAPLTLGAGHTLEQLLDGGLLLRDSEAHIFLCRIVRDGTTKAQIQREAFLGSYSPDTQAFTPVS